MSEKEKTTPAAKAEDAVVEAQVYCGPNIKGVAPQYTVFTDGLPAKLVEKAEAFPIVKALIVPREKFAEMRMKVEKEGTAENILYKKAEALLK